MRPITLLFLIACSGPDAKDSADTDRPPTDVDDTGTTTTDPPDTDTDTIPVGSSESWTDGTFTTTVQTDDADADARTYTLTTDHPQRDGAPQTRTVVEALGEPVLRSGSLVHDALFAMAMADLRESRVSEISDAAFSDGAPTPCDCFETGELWSYVWTRDTAYATHLSLGWIDPARAANSLRFKLSQPKATTGLTGLQIVQDTGSGGSWPVSTDRATWALGAMQTLPHLEGAERDAFLADAAEALANTAHTDHELVLAADGLMRGEQSFLDWREQTYPLWTAADVGTIAEGRALSTNLAHLALLRAAAQLATDPGDAATFQGWADTLEPAVDDGFWVDELQGWSAWSGPALDPGPRWQRDLLSTSLAALLLNEPQRAEVALATYPHGPLGPPVIWPQHPDVPIYHNRAQWPFVTAYSVWAARRVRNAEVFRVDSDALVRGAVLNLSNMENLEWISGEPWVDDGDLSGPVVNSRRQLWSVAGYLALWLRGIGGLELSDDGADLVLDPFLPCTQRDEWLPLGDQIVLRDLPLAGRTIDLELQLPPAGSGCATLQSSSILVDGTPLLAGVPVPLADIADGARIVVELVDTPLEVTRGVSLAPLTLAPAAPSISALTVVADQLQLQLQSPVADTFDVIRDGERVATGVTGSTWTDPQSGDHATTTHCYSVAAVDTQLQVSHRSAPVCWWGPQSERVQVLDAHTFVAGDGAWSTDHGRPHLGSWGDADHTLEVLFRPNVTGPHLVQLEFGNGSGPISTGITAAHKRLTIEPAYDSGPLAADAPVVMPQADAWDQWRDSTSVAATLDASVTSRLVLSDVDGLSNMSWLQHFEAYTGGLGGGTEPYGAVNVASIKLLALDGIDQTPPGDLVVFDGVDDLDDHAPSQVVTPGVTQQPWEAFALDWDDDYLYVTWVAEAFEDPFVPAMLYLEADPAGPPVAGTGMDYSGLVPGLPFTPTHAITVRGQHDAADGLGPWSGVWASQGPGAWQQLRRLQEGVDVFAAADSHTLSLRVPRFLLDDAAGLRVAGHVVNGLPANEYKDAVPAGHTPWTVDGGDTWQINLSGSHDPASW